jgi:uncharacterized membrane protein YgcG
MPYTEAMKRFANIIALLAVIVSVCIVGSVPAQAASVNDFYIQDYQIDYYLDRDQQNHSTLKTVETITAVFPATNQNHGIERAIPERYDGRTTDLQVVSVTDAEGKSQQVSTRSENDNTILRIGDANTYVHGPHTYKITYTQLDVTKHFTDNNSDEFYWDTNGTEWAVPIKALTVRLHVSDTLTPALTHQQLCYRGSAGATNRCDISLTTDGYIVQASSLAPYENVTIAVGFEPHTFAAHVPTLGEQFTAWWLWALVVTIPVAIVLIMWAIARYIRLSYRSAEVNPVVPEYLPPKGISVAVASAISNTTARSFSAQLIDLAVRHYLKIYQTREKSLFKPAKYELEIVKDIATLTAEEQELLRTIFGSGHVGARLDMETLKNNTKVGLKVAANRSKLSKRITGEYALRTRDKAKSTWFMRMAGVILVAALLTLSPWLLLAAIVALICALALRPFTDKGLALYRYLKGLDLYVKTAEAERLRMLQSPEGAAKIGAPVDVNDKRQLIKLYERVLPYAILFGQEKEWNNRLGHYYQEAHAQPDWYSGSHTFNAIAFSAAMHSFNSVASYSSASESSSSGSSGGGSSGGGGGGGGGGGW